MQCWAKHTLQDTTPLLTVMYEFLNAQGTEGLISLPQHFKNAVRSFRHHVVDADYHQSEDHEETDLSDEKARQDDLLPSSSGSPKASLAKPEYTRQNTLATTPTGYSSSTSHEMKTFLQLATTLQEQAVYFLSNQATRPPASLLELLNRIASTTSSGVTAMSERNKKDVLNNEDARKVVLSNCALGLT